MSTIAQTHAADAFRAASAIDPATLRGVIVSVTVVVVLLWCTHYLRRVLTHGWARMDLAHVGTGLFLVLTLLFFIFWTLAHYNLFQA